MITGETPDQFYPNKDIKMFVGFDGKRNYYGAKAWHVIVQAYSLI